MDTRRVCKDEKGHECSPSSLDACCFCAEGAIMAAGAQDTLHEHTLDALRHVLPRSVITWNDYVVKSKREVIRAFRKAIREEEKRYARLWG